MAEQPVVIVAVDGSETAIAAARAGLAVVTPDAVPVVAIVIDAADPGLVVGTGIAGGVMNEEEFAEVDYQLVERGRQDAQHAAAQLGIPDAETVVMRGSAGRALCELAADRNALAIVMGTHGRSGLKRALLGSVSDYVVRHATTPVVITRPE